MPSQRGRVWLAVKTLLALVVIALVARQFVLILQKDEFRQHPIQVVWPWLLPAGLLYLGAHTCWGTFWVRLLRSQGLAVGFGLGLKAYFVSQFGKYIPGKVAVIVMRTEMLRAVGCPRLPVAVTATFETLMSMAAGSLLAIALLPYLGALPEEVSRRVSWVAVIAGLPFVLVFLSKFATKVLLKSRGTDARTLTVPPLLLIAQGLLHGVCGWCLLGLSLACTLRALVPVPLDWTLPGYLADLASIALAYVVGFVVPTPGGLGGREFVLQKALALRFEHAFTMPMDQALGLSVIVALVLRLVWTAAEVVIGVPLYLWKPRSPAPQP